MGLEDYSWYSMHSAILYDHIIHFEKKKFCEKQTVYLKIVQ